MQCHSLQAGLQMWGQGGEGYPWSSWFVSLSIGPVPHMDTGVKTTGTQIAGPGIGSWVEGGHLKRGTELLQHRTGKTVMRQPLLERNHSHQLGYRRFYGTA